MVDWFEWGFKIPSNSFCSLWSFWILTLNWLGFNVETVEYKNVSFTVWDVGGQDKVLWLILWIKALKMHAWCLLIFDLVTGGMFKNASMNLVVTDRGYNFILIHCCRFGLYGDTTFRILRVLYLWLIVMTEIES